MENATPKNEYSERVQQTMNLSEIKSIVKENEQETYSLRFSAVNFVVRFFLLPFLLIVSILTEFAFIYTSVYSTSGSKAMAWLASIIFISIIEGIKVGLGYHFFKGIVHGWLKQGKHYLYGFIVMMLFVVSAFLASIVCSIKGIPLAMETAAEWTYNPPNEELSLINKQIEDATATKWNNTTTATASKTRDKLVTQKEMILASIANERSVFVNRIKEVGTAFRSFGGFMELATILSLLMIATYRRYSYIELPENQKILVRKTIESERNIPVSKK